MMEDTNDVEPKVVETTAREGADLLAQPSDGETPRLAFPVVGVGASAGGLEAYSELLGAMPADTGMAFVLVQHLSPKHESMVAEILSRHTPMPVLQVEDDMPVEPNHVYVIRPGYTMTIKDGRLHLGESLLKPGHSRPVDDFFRSLANEQRERAVAIILSGMGSNGTAGAQAVKVVGGLCIAQDPDSAKFPSMPRSMMDAGAADYVLRPEEIPDVLIRYAAHPYARGARAAEQLARREQAVFGEVLAVLRTRARHDFGGYKKATIMRRIQRRMGLAQVEKFPDYARLLRQSPAEVTALADDLLIHVTGFFRDPEVWEALQARVIRPLVIERPDESAIRVWVTACATGEEAYTLAMLLVEAAEAVHKRFDIKVFATDMAERSLGHARAGAFPGGIESEITPERLARFFDKDDAMYRVKKDLRELVIFAPQNVLQDPPFSRLDIATCRNLLIYLEPDVQRRVLSMLHFGLREGGTLVLGNSETIGDGEHLFEPVDKKLRIFRRVGPTRYGAIDFPVPRLLKNSNGNGDAAPDESRISRASVEHLASKVLLEQYTPAAVVIDRQARIVYFHGDTGRYLNQPRGEPTRDLLSLARDPLRSALRDVVTRCIGENVPAVAPAGLLQTQHGTRRVEITAAPLEQRPGTSFFLISFTDRPELPPLPVADANVPGGDRHVLEELHRVREELQSTIEELQTSNEEMKASNEEVSSVNEELQSTNEELETSKEELQSLNEELSTVNSQLTAKMEELERITNDLSSLLSSTDIAVIFLDTQQRIRRFTPAVKHLVDLIPSDVGRPLSDMAHKFADPDLPADAESVLAKLIPLEREVAAEGGRWYVRRVLPYRTVDNHIEGVVVTFVDITERRAAEGALRKSEERHRALVSKATVGISEVDPQSRFTYANDRFCDMVGRRREDLLAGLTMDDLTHPADRPLCRASMAQVFEGGQPGEIEKRYVRPGGEVVWVSNFVNVIRDADGKTTGAVAAAVDVTARRQAEQSLRESEARFRAFADVGPDLLWEADPRGHVLWCNRRWTDYTGQTADQIRGYGWLDVVHPDDRVAAHRTYQTAIDTGQPMRCEYRIRNAQRQYRWFLGQALPMRDDAGRVLHWFGAATDIHEHRTSLNALRESEERFRLALEAARMGFWDWDVRAGTMTWDATHNRILGLPADQRQGSPEQVLACIHPGDRDRVNALTRHAMDCRVDYDTEMRVVHPDGSVHWVSAYGRALAEDGVATRMIGGVLDITDRKRIEQERVALLEGEQAARAAAETANATKDQFLANASHELRTPLSAILLWSALLQADDVDPATQHDGLAAIEHSAKAQQKLIEDLMDNARISAGKIVLDLRPADLAALMAAATDTIRPAAEAKGVAIAVDFGRDVGQARIDAGRLQQVVWNLVSNAVKFTPSGGRVDVVLKRRGDEVEIRVADTGPGIAADVLPEIFARFSQGEPGTTRRFGGLGLGLSISRQLVELHGGRIEAASDGLGRGSVFTVRLPLPRQPAGKAEPAPVKAARAPKTAAGPAVTLTGVHVLLVEDDAMTRDAMVRTLKKSGATIDAVAHADAALAALRSRRPDVIVSDIGLPDKDGYTFMAEFRAAETGDRLPAVALSAFDRPQDQTRASESGYDAYLSKPVEPKRLLALLKKLLAK